MTVTLDEKSHIYTLEDGRHPTPVSSILNIFFPFPTQFMPADAAEIGTVRHQWFHELAQGHEIENEPDPRISGEVAGFIKFMAEAKPHYVIGEKSFFDPVLNVCGTPDLIAEISGRLAVIDFKPHSKNKRTRLQTAAYSLMLRSNKFPILDRYELRLLCGDYRLDKHRNTDDERRWPILVAAFHAASYYK
jgi:hypothetical protein